MYYSKLIACGAKNCVIKYEANITEPVCGVYSHQNHTEKKFIMRILLKIMFGIKNIT